MRWSSLLLSLVVVLCVQGSLRACPMCAEAVTQTTGADEADQFREAEAYNLSIYLMVFMPYSLVGTVGYFVYRGLHQKAQLAQLSDDASAMAPSGGLSCPPPSTGVISLPAPPAL